MLETNLNGIVIFEIHEVELSTETNQVAMFERCDVDLQSVEVRKIGGLKVDEYES